MGRKGVILQCEGSPRVAMRREGDLYRCCVWFAGSPRAARGVAEVGGEFADGALAGWWFLKNISEL